MEHSGFSFYVNSSRSKGEGERVIVLIELRINQRPVAHRQMSDFFSGSTIRLQSDSEDFSFTKSKLYDNNFDEKERSPHMYETRHFDSLTVVIIYRKLLPTGKYTILLDDYFQTVKQNSLYPFEGNVHITSESRPDSPSVDFRWERMEDGKLFLLASGVQFSPSSISVEISVPQLEGKYFHKERVLLRDDGKGADLHPNDEYFTAIIEPFNCGKHKQGLGLG